MSRRRWGALLYLIVGVSLAALAFAADTDTLRILAGVGAVLGVALALMNWRVARED